MTAGLYLHFPFCTHRCGYCDFYTVADRDALIPAYINALLNEIELYARHGNYASLAFSTLYFGGGTPSLMSTNQLSAIVGKLLSSFRFSSSPEITLEVNPETVDLAKLQAIRQAGVNRLSIGFQSFQPGELLFLERTHNVQTSITCYENARSAGFENISLDLIFALPGQTIRTWQYNLAEAVFLAPEHVSAYALTFEEGTPLTSRLKKGTIKSASEKTQSQMHLKTISFLRDEGYAQYEISNYAKPGKESGHNSKYWDGSPYLGLGVSSHSFVNGRRFWNVRNMNRYIEALADHTLAVDGEEFLSRENILVEKIWLGLRQRKGLNIADFENLLQASFFATYKRQLAAFFDEDLSSPEMAAKLRVGSTGIASKLLKIEGGFLRLTDQGIVLCEAICGEFI
jgi:oxygen-independent coproporphyrinogen-3 oxidase